ncbi:MAG TPA: energy transducer TonB [Steroidobacteraceae bacterium]|jgi:TonB family protein|nr:energy transducer TonB [Steroidobacteraceae bacterium]
MANAQHTRSAQGTSDEVNLEFDAHRTGAEEAHHPPILVLSRDPNLVETVKKAAPRGTAVVPAPDLDHVAGKLSDLRPGVLVADTASTADVAAMVAQLTQHFPELVVIVAGKREDSAALMQLTATGRIFRFLLTPLSHGQTRLALEAAVTQHQDLLAQGQRLSASSGTTGGDNKNYVMTYGALAAGLLIVIGGIWFGVNKFTGEPTPPVVVQQPTPAGQPGGVPEKIDPVQAELQLAKDAFSQGKYLEPAGDSALDYYRSALALDPNSAAAKEGIRDVVDKILERAEQSLTSEKLEDASRNIELARDIDPAHPRLAFLDTQMGRERERIKLSQAADVANRVKTLVNQANDRMQNGRLITPANGSARDALTEARRLDATDPNVVQSVRDFAALMTEEARKSVAEGNMAEAQNYVTIVRQMGSAGAALAAVERQLADANKAAAAATQQRRAQPSTAASDPLVADIRQRIAEGKLIDPPGDSARDLLVNLRNTAPARPEVEELSKQLTNRLLESGKGATAAKAYPRAEQLIAAARDVGARYNEPAIAQAEKDLTSAREANALATNIVSANSLKRTRTVQPVYPEAARKKGIEGWVELAFTVAPNGTVQDVEVRNASPANVFDDAAVRAIRGWRFEPVERDGEKVSQRAMVRLRFAQSPNQ